MTRRHTPRGEARRSSLLAAATRLFAERGFHPTSVNDIVAEIGVGKGVFYWYFESKEALLTEILRSAQRDLRRFQQRAIADDPDPLRRIEHGLRATIQWSAAHRDLLVLVQFAESEERFAESIRRGEQIAVADVVRHIQEGIAGGHIVDGDPRLMAHAILGVAGRLARLTVVDPTADIEELADAAAAFGVGGLVGLPVGVRPT